LYICKKIKMITTLNINKISDIDNDFIITVLKNMFANYGEIELIIKTKENNLNNELSNRIEKVEKGEELLTFEIEEFDKLNKNLIKGITQDKTKIRRLRKN